MIHARGRARGLEKLIISRKLKSSLGGGAAFVFARRHPSRPSPHPRARRTAEILNESLLMKATSRALLSAVFLAGRGEARGRRRGRGGGCEEENRMALFRFPRFIINTWPETFSRFRLLFFFSTQLVRASELQAAKNEIPRFRQKFTFPRAAIVIALEQV